MDHSDEKNHRAGDVLGLGDVVSGSEPAAQASQDPDEVRKRRARMQEGADDLTPAGTETPRSSGATGIDMGAGGQGTDVE